MGKEDDVHIYGWVLDCYLNNNQDKKARFIARFKDNLFIGFDNSNLLT